MISEQSLTWQSLAQNPAALQPKLAVSQPDDPYEREADRVADRVMRMANPVPAGSENSLASFGTGKLQRKCASCEDEEELSVQRQAGSATASADAPPLVYETLKSPGQRLDPATRSFMEERFDRDFGEVRVHADMPAAKSARSINALAYTVGRNVVFDSGAYAPQTTRGRTLLAHELAHVVQQEQGGQRVSRFESRVHESIERQGLTTPTGGGAMTNEEASAVYFGNWMRDMNQVFVPMVQRLLPDDVSFSLIRYLAARKFRRELTPEQFGYYIPAEHIDNPAGLVGAGDLRPVQPSVAASAAPPVPSRLGAARPPSLDTPQDEVSPSIGTIQGVNIFAVDQTGVMAFIRRTNLHIERRLQLAAAAGRTPDGMQHLGAALHSVEDLFSHSNYIEIAVNQLVRSDPTFLTGLTGAQRQVFTYSASARVPGGAGGTAQDRPVLTTGSFTGTDTQVSIASELVGFLSRPLPAPTGREEQAAQERFILSLLRNYDAQIRNNSQLQQTVRQALTQAGAPDFIAWRANQLPMATIYQASTILNIPIPDAIRLPLKTAIREALSTHVLQPRARQLQAAALDARIVDTSLIQVLRDSQRQASGTFTPTELAAMEARAQTIGPSRAQQETESTAAGHRRADAIQATPLPVVAGPSHSQIAKDHPNSPFFGLAVLLASVAVQRLRDRMLAVWNERQGTPTTPFNFDWGNYPAAAPPGAPPADVDAYESGRRLYHVRRGSPEHGREIRESLQRGQEIVAQGGSPGQPYDLATIRRESAEEIRSVARALQAMAGAPGATQTALTRFRDLLGRLNPEAQERIRTQLNQTIAAARAAGASQAVMDLNTVAASLMSVSTQVENARMHADRERANAALVQQRTTMQSALATRPSLDVGLATALLYTLDEQIRTTAVAYSSEQRAVLEGRSPVPEMGASPPGLTVATLTLPPVSGSPAMISLLNEARLLVNHPYENRWWESDVRNYARQNPARLINDIEARNEGVPFYPVGAAGQSHGP
ncbi:MAG TPA: DUF4157 domain-containing protein [Pyrinomonadaceae bacterium]|nr:DUF4157 domain-containing protein [Pyrinomonadaceae bacterium]